MEYQALPPVDVFMASTGDTVLAELVDAFGDAKKDPWKSRTMPKKSAGDGTALTMEYIATTLREQFNDPDNVTFCTLGRGWLYHQFAITVPEEAMKHPIWRILEDPEQNKQAIAKMPVFLGTNYMQRLKPAATVLANSSTPIPQAGIMPIFADQPYGRGRTFAFAPDTTADWGRYFESQWGESGDNRYFRRFWRNIVRARSFTLPPKATSIVRSTARRISCRQT